MSHEEASAVAIGGLTGRMVSAPPVYAPGGPVCLVLDVPTDVRTVDPLLALASEASKRGAVLTVVRVLQERTEVAAGLQRAGFTAASAWYDGPTATRSGAPEIDGVRPATAADVPAILEIAERKRRQYAEYQPVFWRMAPVPRQTFAPYMTDQVNSDRNIALVYDGDDRLRGFLIAQADYIDDYAVSSPEEWPTVGVALLQQTMFRAAERGIGRFRIVTAVADVRKRDSVESQGFRWTATWYVRGSAT